MSLEVLSVEPKYKRILLKLSGESLAGSQKHGIDFDTVLKICKPIKEIADMGVDYDGNFVCSGGMRVLPVWTSDPQSLCQQSEMQQQPSGNPFDQSSQPQQQPQQQPAQQEQKDSDGVAGWIKDMFGSN